MTMSSVELHRDVTIRRAAPADANALAEFAERTFRDTFERDNRPEDMSRYVADTFGPDKQRAELADSRGIVLLMESATRVIGYAQLLCGVPPAEVTPVPAMELQRFYIAREYHGHGLAQLLMTEALTTALERNAVTLWLGVWERNARAISFYRKVGFADVGRQTFVLGDDKQTDRIMCRAARV